MDSICATYRRGVSADIRGSTRVLAVLPSVFK